MVKKKTKAASEPEYTMEELLTKTQELMDDNNYETALKFVAKAIEMDERNTQALLLAAIIQLESGEMEPALNCLLRSVEISPDRGFEKYMYLGQFSIELEAVKYFQLGVDAIQRDLAELPADSEQAAMLKRKIAEAYVAMTEIYLTDCCFEQDAEKKCEQFLELGVQADPQCPEVYQTMASVRLSQDRPDDARKCVSQSMSLWADKDQNDPTQIPSYENRLALVRLLLELEERDQALALLERLQKEDDESIDMWYLYGWTYHLQSEDAADGSEEKAELLSSARECFNQAIKLAGILDYENDGLIDHARELVEGINAVVPASLDDDVEKDNNGANDPDADESDGEDWDDIVSEDEDQDVEMNN
ncbi:hypothetical protein GGI07_005738 [Coemansia sp. Benny D115]|nr:hypothetical protein GGI07_005738 [Coemansia sp. Benny D115]